MFFSIWMVGLLLINTFSIYFLTPIDTHVRSANRLRENLLECNKYIDGSFFTEAVMYKRLSIDEILHKYGKEMTWDIKSGCMGKRKLL